MDANMIIMILRKHQLINLKRGKNATIELNMSRIM